jgi:hypothetical protein
MSGDELFDVTRRLLIRPIDNPLHASFSCAVNVRLDVINHDAFFWQ